MRTFEYGLVIILVGAAVIFGGMALTASISRAFTDAAARIEGAR